MTYLLDTNVLSESTRPRPSEKVGAWIGQQTPVSLHTSSIVIAELWRGVLRRGDDRGAALARWIEDEVLDMLKGRILPFTAQTAKIWGDMVAHAEAIGRPRPLADSYIAATALEHGLTIVSRNAADFAGLGVAVLDPWTN